MQGLWVALGFLTRVPVPAAAFGAPRAQARSLPWYPLVGAFIGALLCALAACVPTSPPLAAALLLVAWVALTGGLHIDGLADSADAWIGGMGDRERTLAIMKDPRCGPAGVTAVVLVLLLKFAALSSLAAQASRTGLGGPLNAGLLLAPLLARATLTAALLGMPYVREGGLGQALPQASRAACHAALGLTTLACLMPALDTPAVPVEWLMPGILAIVAAGVVAFAWLRACRSRIGGVTGDTCGALAEMVEVAVLVALACWFA